MARPLRIEYPGAVYHITGRGNERKPIYKDDHDREAFLSILKRTNDRHNWTCHSYCLMDNHYHLLIETLDGNLSIGMRQLNGVYTQFFNNRHNRTGHLFQGRYKAILIQKDNHLLEVCRYIVLNPIRAGAVGQPEDWKWSSYQATASRGQPHPCLTRAWILEQFAGKRLEAEKEYRQFVKEGIEKESIWSGVKAQAILGEDEFIGSLTGHFKKNKDVNEIPKSQRYLNRPSLEKIFPEIIIKDKNIRNRMILEAVEQYGYRQSEIARYLGMHYSTRR